MIPRKCENWLHTLAQFAENNESPRKFWVWAGLFTLNAALERRVWLPFGMDCIYPNLFVMCVAPPGRCRKATPPTFAKRILADVQLNIFADSASKRALTKKLHEISRTCAFSFIGPDGVRLNKPQCPLVIVSKELSSFLAVNLKEMVEVLTDLWDNHDKWDYETSEKGKDSIHGVCLSCYFATTPIWVARNLPPESIGGGFTSRFVVIHSSSKYKSLSLPPPPDQVLYKMLVDDLAAVRRISGEFRWEPEAFDIYDKWYHTIEPRVQATFDERIQVFLERIHVVGLKVAMALRVAYSSDLVITASDMQLAIKLVDELEQDIPKAFGAQGSASENAVNIQRISSQIRTSGKLTVGELLRFNYHNINRPMLVEVIDTLVEMGNVKRLVETRKGRPIEVVQWLGREGICEQDEV